MLTIIVGNEDDLKKHTRQWEGNDVITVKHHWRRALRLKQIMVLFAMASGWTGVAVMPQEEFDITTHKIPNKYKVSGGFLGINLKRNTMMIFGTDEALGPLAIERGQDGKPGTDQPEHPSDEGSGRTDQHGRTSVAAGGRTGKSGGGKAARTGKKGGRKPASKRRSAARKREKVPAKRQHDAE